MGVLLKYLHVLALASVSMQGAFSAAADTAIAAAHAGVGQPLALPDQSNIVINSHHQKAGLQRKLLLRGLADTGPPAAPAAAAALPNNAPLTTARHLLQSCDEPDMISCNSEPLCSAVGRWQNGRSTHEMGTQCECITMCELALQWGGQCHQQWNPPTESYYFRIQYGGPVDCDPIKGGGGGRKDEVDYP